MDGILYSEKENCKIAYQRREKTLAGAKCPSGKHLKNSLQNTLCKGKKCNWAVECCEKDDDDSDDDEDDDVKNQHCGKWLEAQHQQRCPWGLKAKYSNQEAPNYTCTGADGCSKDECCVPCNDPSSTVFKRRGRTVNRNCAFVGRQKNWGSWCNAKTTQKSGYGKAFIKDLCPCTCQGVAPKQKLVLGWDMK